MTPATQRKILWGGTLCIGVLLIGVAIYIGLDQADKLASVVSAIGGLIAIALAIYQLWIGPSGGSTPTGQTQQGGDNSINLQAGNDLTIGDNGKFGKP